MPDMLVVADAERVERGDVEFLSQEARDVSRHIAGTFLTNPSGQQAWILGGFGITNPSLKQCRVTRGQALLYTREKGQVVVGALTSEGQATITPDLATYANGTYNVYIRFETADGAFQNRVFWDPVALAEFSQNVPTRRLASWGVAVALTSPGGEWFKIGEVVVSVSPTLAVTQKRQLYFEGDEANSYITGWGAGLDRDNNRAVNGVQDLRTFVAAMNQKMKEIQGHNWWLSTADPLNNKLSKTGDTGVGTYAFNGGSVAFGSNVVVNGTLNANSTFQVNGTIASLRALGTAQALVHLQNSANAAEYADLVYNVVGLNFFALVSDALVIIAPSGTDPLTNPPLVVGQFGITPGRPDAYVGNLGAEWDSGYINNLNVQTILGTHVGSGSGYFADGFVDLLNVQTGIRSGNGGVSQIGANTREFNVWMNDLHVAAAGRVSGNLLPNITNQGHLGDGTNRWQQGYFQKLDVLAVAPNVACFFENGGNFEVQKLTTTANGIFQNFVAPDGNSGQPVWDLGGTNTGTGSKIAAIRVTVNGSVRWLYLYDTPD